MFDLSTIYKQPIGFIAIVCSRFFGWIIINFFILRSQRKTKKAYYNNNMLNSSSHNMCDGGDISIMKGKGRFSVMKQKCIGQRDEDTEPSPVFIWWNLIYILRCEMEYFRPCRVSTISKIGRFAALCLYPFTGVGLIFVTFLLAIEVLASDNHTAGQLILYILTTLTTILLSIWLFAISKNCYQMESRHISFDIYGFAIRKRVSNQYAWETVESIGVIAYAADASKELFQTQICIFLSPVNDIALRKLRDGYLYGAFNMDKYVLLDYDPILHKELEDCSGLSVVDLRSHQLKI